MPKLKVQAYFIVLVIIIVLALSSNLRLALVAHGCDAFGYARQAQLFRDNGLIGGLDTAIHDPAAKALSETMKNKAPVEHWTQAVAPHCHHYRESTDKVILQYPPGTGLILSLWSEPVALQSVYIIGLGSVMLLLASLFVWAHPPWTMTLITSLVIWVYGWTVAHKMNFISASIPLSMFLIPWACYLVGHAFPTSAATMGMDTIENHRYHNKRLILALLFGLCCGLMLSVRLPNIFVLSGLALQILLSQPRRLCNRKEIEKICVAVLGFILMGPLLIMATQWINTGNPFHSTYTPIDTTPPEYSYELLQQNLVWYYQSYGGRLLALASVMVLWALLWPFMMKWGGALKKYVGLKDKADLPIIAADTSKMNVAFTPATMGALLTFGLSFFYFMTHRITTPYYLVPTAVACVFMVLFERLRFYVPIRQEQVKPDDKRFSVIDRLTSKGHWLILLPILLLIAHRYHMIKPYTLSYELPDALRANKSISLVVGDAAGSCVYYYGSVYSVKIGYIQNFALAAVAIEGMRQKGFTQYFIGDSADSLLWIEKLQERFSLIKVSPIACLGVHPTWKLPAHQEDNPITTMPIH